MWDMWVESVKTHLPIQTRHEAMRQRYMQHVNQRHARRQRRCSARPPTRWATPRRSRQWCGGRAKPDYIVCSSAKMSASASVPMRAVTWSSKVILQERILEQKEKKKGNLSQWFSFLSIRIVNWSSESIFSYSWCGSSTNLSLKAIFWLRFCNLESSAYAKLIYSGFWMTGLVASRSDYT